MDESYLKAKRKKVRAKIKFSNKIILLCFKFFSWKIIFPLLNVPFNNNIAILESKIIYFCVRSNFRECTALKGSSTLKAVFFALFRNFI